MGSGWCCQASWPVAEPAVASQGSLPSPPPCWLLLLVTLTRPQVTFLCGPLWPHL